METGTPHPDWSFTDDKTRAGPLLKGEAIEGSTKKAKSNALCLYCSFINLFKHYLTHTLSSEDTEEDV